MDLNLSKLGKKIKTHLFWDFKWKKENKSYMATIIITLFCFVDWDSSYMRWEGEKTKVSLFLYKQCIEGQTMMRFLKYQKSDFEKATKNNAPTESKEQN